LAGAVGCVSDSRLSFFWTQDQLDTGNCNSTPFMIDAGEEVGIFEEMAVTAKGTCVGVLCTKVQSIADPELEGWIAADAIDLLEPSSSCSR